VSILWRDKPCLTLTRLVPAWAEELSADRGTQVTEQDLFGSFFEDAANGLLDHVGPLKDGRRLGLAIITPSGEATSVEGGVLAPLLTSEGITSCPFFDRPELIVVMKEAVLDFAQRHNLSPPSWWAEQPRRGPKPGTVDRFGESDQALFPEMERIMREDHKSVHAAALELASRIEGAGTEASRAKRLASRYRRARTDTR
jgi:hypothetical protein